MPSTISPAPRSIAPLLGLLLGIIPFVIAAQWSGGPSKIPDALHSLSVASPAALAWIVSAFGLGWPLRRWWTERSAAAEPPAAGPLASSAACLQLGGGVAVALLLDSILGTLGVMSQTSAWALTLGGCALAAICLWRDPPARYTCAPLVCAAAPALAILLLASTSAPGWLWSTEFGGYDALSYHLQLPKEWFLAGAIQPTPHCVYGYLPNYLESAYLRLMLLHGHDAGAPHRAALSAQFLHALLAIGAAWCTGQAAARWSLGRHATSPSAAVATILVLATPWVVVVGSLAYSEMPVLLLLACGLIVVAPEVVGQPAPSSLGSGVDVAPAPSPSPSWVTRAVAVGTLAGAACGAKLTAALFVAVPLGILLLWSLPTRRWLAAAGLSIAAATVILSPWLLRNVVATGNPVFPFATSLLGSGHWSPEQVRIFSQGHGSDLPFSTRMSRLWEQLLIFGLGDNPRPGEPWRPLWSITPWLAGAAAVVLAWPAGGSSSATSSRRVVQRLSLLLLVQIVAWLAITHLQSRFLLPAVVPMAMIVGAAADRLCSTRSGGWLLGNPRRPSFAWAALAALSLVPMFVYQRERGGAPSAAIGASAFFAGEGEAGGPAEENPSHWLNFRLPSGSRVLLVGDARPFWYLGAPAEYTWQTTWDRGPLSAVLASHPDEPSAQRRALRREGFTHLLIDFGMLDRWRRSGWNDPRLTPEAVAPLLAAPNRIVKRFVGGATLVELSNETDDEAGEDAGGK